jgi:hypothetical protein
MTTLEAAALRHEDLMFQERFATEEMKAMLERELYTMSLLVVDTALNILRTHTLNSFAESSLRDWTYFYCERCGELSTSPKLSMYAIMLNYYNCAFVPSEFKRPILYLWGPEFVGTKRWKRMLLTYLYGRLNPYGVSELQYEGHKVVEAFEFNFFFRDWRFDVTFVEKNQLVKELRDVMKENVEEQLVFSDDEGEGENLLSL